MFIIITIIIKHISQFKFYTMDSTSMNVLKK